MFYFIFINLDDKSIQEGIIYLFKWDIACVSFLAVFDILLAKISLWWAKNTSAQFVTLLKYFWHPSFNYLVFLTPPINLKLGQQIGGRLLIATHLGQSNYLVNQN